MPSFALITNQPTLVHTSYELVSKQCTVLRSSSKSDPELDLLLSAHAEAISLASTMQVEMRPNIDDDHMPEDFTIIRTHLDEGAAKVDLWAQKWRQEWDLITGSQREGNDMPEPLLSAYHFLKLWIHGYAGPSFSRCHLILRLT